MIFWLNLNIATMFFVCALVLTFLIVQSVYYHQGDMVIYFSFLYKLSWQNLAAYILLYNYIILLLVTITIEYFLKPQ